MSDIVVRCHDMALECEAVAKERAETEGSGLHYMNTCDYAYALVFRNAAEELIANRALITQLEKELADERAELKGLHEILDDAREHNYEHECGKLAADLRAMTAERDRMRKGISDGLRAFNSEDTITAINMLHRALLASLPLRCEGPAPVRGASGPGQEASVARTGVADGGGRAMSEQTGDNKTSKKCTRFQDDPDAPGCCIGCGDAREAHMNLKQRAMSMLSRLVNDAPIGKYEAHELVRQLLEAKWNEPSPDETRANGIATSASATDTSIKEVSKAGVAGVLQGAEGIHSAPPLGGNVFNSVVADIEALITCIEAKGQKSHWLDILPTLRESIAILRRRGSSEETSDLPCSCESPEAHEEERS